MIEVNIKMTEEIYGQNRRVVGAISGAPTVEQIVGGEELFGKFNVDNHYIPNDMQGYLNSAMNEGPDSDHALKLRADLLRSVEGLEFCFAVETVLDNADKEITGRISGKGKPKKGEKSPFGLEF